MEDLSAQVFPDGPIAVLCPTSQAGGNRFSGRDAAQSAPGSKTTAGAVTEAAQPGPYTSGDAHKRTTVTGKTGRK